MLLIRPVKSLANTSLPGPSSNKSEELPSHGCGCLFGLEASASSRAVSPVCLAHVSPCKIRAHVCFEISKRVINVPVLNLSAVDIALKRAAR